MASSPQPSPPSDLSSSSSSSSLPPKSSPGTVASSSSPPPTQQQKEVQQQKSSPPSPPNPRGTPSSSTLETTSSMPSSKQQTPDNSKETPSSKKGNGKEGDSSGGGHGGLNIPLVAGVTAGVIVFLLMMLISCIVLRRKKKGSNYYPEPSRAGSKSQGSRVPMNMNDYYASSGPWQDGPMHHNPGGQPGAPWHPGAGGIHGQNNGSSDEFSSGVFGHGMGGGGGGFVTDSGPHGPVLPPPSPAMALGFNKSTFTYEELAAATNRFSQANLLGQGGFGYVHKGVLPNGKEVAVKSLKSGSGQGEREFQAEVEIISRVHHRHLVSLVGYCIAGGQRMLVYEFVPNGTLEYHLYANDKNVMDFPTRLKIALGSAKGLAYLHEDCHPKIIHRDIKTANILIDYKFEAMVADFGLAKLSADNFTHVSTRVMGTFGYLAPEYASSGKLTEKSDVFSFGVMLLELVTGRRPVDTTQAMMEDSLVDWARPLMSQALFDGNFDELVDRRLGSNYDTAEMARMVASAAACVRHVAKRRPKMSQIVRALEGDSTLEDLNDGVRPALGSMLGSSTSSELETGSYSYKSQMKTYQKANLASSEFGSVFGDR